MLLGARGHSHLFIKNVQYRLCHMSVNIAAPSPIISELGGATRGFTVLGVRETCSL